MVKGTAAVPGAPVEELKLTRGPSTAVAPAGPPPQPPPPTPLPPPNPSLGGGSRAHAPLQPPQLDERAAKAKRLACREETKYDALLRRTTRAKARYAQLAGGAQQLRDAVASWVAGAGGAIAGAGAERRTARAALEGSPPCGGAADLGRGIPRSEEVVALLAGLRESQVTHAEVSGFGV